MTIRVYVFIALVLGVLFWGVRMVEAEGVVELSTSSEQVDVGESFELGVSLKQAGVGSVRVGGVDIPGSESFQVRGTSTSTSMQVVNGQSAALTTIVYTLVPTEEGSFSLGPVIMDGVESNVVEVSVSEKSKTPIAGVMGSKKSLEDTPVFSDDKPNSGWWVLGLLLTIVGLGLLIIVKLASKKQPYDVGDEGGKEVVNSGEEGESTQEEVLEKKEIPQKLDEEIVTNTHEYKSEEYYMRVKESLITYLEDKHEVKLKQLSSSEVTAVLNEKDEGKITEIASVLYTCDQAIYAKKQPNNKELKQTLLEITN